MIEFALHGHVATLTLARPPANAFTAEGCSSCASWWQRSTPTPKCAPWWSPARREVLQRRRDLNGFAEATALMPA